MHQRLAVVTFGELCGTVGAELNKIDQAGAPAVKVIMTAAYSIRFHLY